MPAAPQPAALPLWRRLLPLLGLGLLAILLSRLDGQAMAAAAGRVSPRTLLAAVGAFLANLLVKAFRWHRLLRAQGHPLPAQVSLAAFLSGQFYGHVTVGRLGEFYRAEALTDRGLPAGRALSSCLVDRLFDLALVLLLGAGLGAFVLGQRRIWVGALALFGLGLLGAGALWMLRPRDPAAHTSHGPLGRARRLARDLWTGSAALIRPLPVLEATLWTCLGWLGHFGAVWILAGGMGIDADRILLTTATCMGALSALLPVTVSGLGARELIYAQILARQHVAPEAAVVLALLHLGMMTTTAIGIGLPGLLWRRRQRLQDA